jgi:hypothetical protein
VLLVVVVDYLYFVYETFILAGVPCGGNIYQDLSFRTKASLYIAKQYYEINHLR